MWLEASHALVLCDERLNAGFSTAYMGLLQEWTGDQTFRDKVVGPQLLSA